MKIESLTEEQQARFSEFIEKWTAIGLSTEKADRKEAEKGIVEMYAIAGLKKPKIVWCDSPLSQGITRHIVMKLEADGLLKKGKKIGASVRASVGASVWASVRASVRDSVWDSVWASVGDSVGASVWDSVGDSVWASVWASVRASVRASVGDSVGASVRDSVGASVRDSVWASVGDSVGASVRDSVRASVGASVWASVGDSVRASVRDSVWASVRDSVWASVGDSVGASGYGQHDANWLAFYDFFSEVCGLKDETKKLSGLWKLSKNAGWFLPHENICWVSERHNKLSRDERGRLHSELGMAVAYPDGWGIYALHGVRFEETLWKKIVSKEITSKEALAIQSSDQRAIALNFIGGERLMKDFDGKVIATDEYGELIELPGLLDTNKVPYKYLKAYNPESKDFVYLRTWPEVKTPAEAEARSYRLDRIGKKYQPDSRT